MTGRLFRVSILLAAIFVFVMLSTVQADPPPPVQGTPEVVFELRTDPERLLWTDVEPGGTHFDLVRGDLTILLQTGGDFTQATEVCLASDQGGRSFDDGDIPAPGRIFWYVVRGVNETGAGTYDELSPRQVGSRDAEIDASAGACPLGGF